MRAECVCDVIETLVTMRNADDDEYVILHRNLWKWTTNKQTVNYFKPVLHLFSPANWPNFKHWRFIRLEMNVILKRYSKADTVCLWRHRNFCEYAGKADDDEYVILHRNLWKWTNTKQTLNYSTPVLHLFSPANWPISKYSRSLGLGIDVILKDHSNADTVCLWRNRKFCEYAGKADDDKYVIFHLNFWKWTTKEQSLIYSTSILRLCNPASWPISPSSRLLWLEIAVLLKAYSNVDTVCVCLTP